MKVLLITGASTGIGAETARQAVAAGYKVVLAARSSDKLKALCAELGGPDKALAVSCDVTDWDSQKAMFGAALKAFGQIDAVFANAGIGASAMGTENGDADNFRAMILTNALGVTYTAKLAIPELKKTKGHLLITGSRAGRVSLSGSVYGATKWFVTGYGQNLAQEMSGTGVRVTVIEPGMVDTPFFDEPKPKALKSEDVAGAVMYALAQPAHVHVSEILMVPTPQAD
jgi:NADP-dependent 3-hydroxy acid dehydrogenase YdfG